MPRTKIYEMFVRRNEHITNADDYKIRTLLKLKEEDINAMPIEDIRKGKSEKFIRFIFAYRLQVLMDCMSHKEVAKTVKISSASLSDFFNAKSEARMCNLARLAGYLNVSTDYLLGLTDTKTTNPNKKNTCEYLGLPDSTIDAIKSMTDDKEYELYKTMLSQFISCGYLRQIISTLEESAITLTSFKLVYGQDDNQFKRQLDTLEYQFTKTLGSIFANFTTEYISQFSDTLSNYISENIGSLAAATMQVEDLLHIVNEYIQDADAQRIYQKLHEQ